MNSWRTGGAAVLLALGMAIGVQAQPAPPAGASGLLALCQAIEAKLKACKAKFCACPLGQMVTNFGKPLNTFTGGLFCPPCCPPVSDADKKKAATSAEGACARITQEELDMPGRRRAVRCLSRADCHWWPEAETALIGSLRTDRNECVRLEAALALGKGCCCTRKTIEALLITVTGSNKDGNPSENSDRVKSAAHAALQHCLLAYSEPAPGPPEKPPKPDKPDSQSDSDPGILKPTAFAVPTSRPGLEVIEEARRVVQEMRPPPPGTLMPTGQRNFLGILRKTNEPAGKPDEMPKLKPVPDPALAPTTHAAAGDVIPAAAHEPPVTGSAAPAAPLLVPAVSAVAVATDIQGCIRVLQSSPVPDQRRQAVRELAQTDWNAHPHVPTALLEAGNHDADPEVRISCIRCLAQHRVRTARVVTALRNLRLDPDARVRNAASDALAILGPG